MIEYLSKSEDDTLAFAGKIGSELFCGAIILLTGNLGAGKTVFVKGLAKGLGYEGLVKSPSYTIMNIYEANIPLIHFDLYRLNNSDEFFEIGGDEYLGGKNICAVEWHSNAKDAFSDNFIEVIIRDIDDKKRLITVLAQGMKHKKWLESIKDDFNS